MVSAVFAADPEFTWEALVEQCADAFRSGVPAKDVGTPLVGRFVRWEGIVEQVNAKGRAVRGLSIKMPAVEVALPDNRTFVGNWLFLAVAHSQLVSPAYCGKTIVFTGRFQAHGVFPNLEFQPDDEQQKVFLGLLLEDGRVLASQ